MKKKDLLYSALGVSIGLGIMYMGKAKIFKNLQKDNIINYNGQLTSKAKTTIKQIDYNNAIKASDDYWLTQGIEGDTENIFYDDDGNKIMYDENGNIKIGFWDSVKTGLKSLIFWK